MEKGGSQDVKLHALNLSKILSFSWLLIYCKYEAQMLRSQGHSSNEKKFGNATSVIKGYNFLICN
jgi:hypothetical protein